MFELKFSKFQVNNTQTGNIYSFRDIAIPNDFHSNLPFLLRAMLYRNKINMNTFLLEVGNPRTSKSYCALKLAEMYSEKLDMKFDVEQQLTFDDLKKFFKWSQNANNSIFILDETGTTLSPDMFWSVQQRIMRRFVQCQGFRKNVLIWVLPSIVFIQKGFRFMANYALKTLSQGNAEVYKVVVDQLLGKGYPERIETLHYTFPSKETSEKYELMKKEWNDIELKDDIAFLDKMERNEKYMNKNEILEMFRKKTVDYDFAFNELVNIGYDVGRADLFLQHNTDKPLE